MDKINKVLNFEIKQVGHEEDRVLRFVGSDETPDRDNDIIEVTGWKLDDYLKNPVFLWAHDYSQPPVGKAVNVSIDAVTKKLLFDVKFATADEYPFADTIYKLYKGGYLSATSVGFRGVKFKTRDDDSVLEMPEWRRGRRYMEQNLLELSAVPVPCNPNALQQAKSAGIDTDDVEKAMELKEVDLLVDSNTKEVFVCVEGQKTAKVKISEEYYDAIFEEKAGATLSKKTKEMLTKVCDDMKGCGDKLRKFIDTAGMMEDEPMMTAERTASALETIVKIELSEEFKQALDEIKNQVSLLIPKDATKVEFDLEAIDAKALLPTDELVIEPEMLKRMISESVGSMVTASVNESIKNLKTGGINQ